MSDPCLDFFGVFRAFLMITNWICVPRITDFHSSFTLPSSSSNPAKYSSDFPPPTFRTVSIRRSITLLRDKVIKMPLTTFTTYIIYMHIYVHSHSRMSALVTLFPPQDLYNGHRSRREDYSRAVTMVQATPWDWELLQKIYHFQFLPLGFVFGLKNWILKQSYVSFSVVKEVLFPPIGGWKCTKKRF